MLKIYLLVEGNQRGIVQFAGDLIEHGADLRRQTGFAHQWHHVLTRLLMFIIFQNHPFLLRQIALGGDDRRDIDFARIERQPGQRPAHVQRFHRFELKTIDAFQPRQARARTASSGGPPITSCGATGFRSERVRRWYFSAVSARTAQAVIEVAGAGFNRVKSAGRT